MCNFQMHEHFRICLKFNLVKFAVFGAPKPNTLHYIFIFGKLKIMFCLSGFYFLKWKTRHFEFFFCLVVYLEITRLNLTCQLPITEIISNFEKLFIIQFV